MFGVIWWVLLVPVIATVFLLGWHRKATNWMELIGMWVISILLIIGGQALADKVGTMRTEYWGHLGIRAEHNEPYSYWTTCTETYACGETCTGSGSNRTCTTNYCTRTYPCIEDVSRKCYVDTRKADRFSVSYGKYQELMKRWGGKETFTDMYRERQHGRDLIKKGKRGYTGDGNRYTTFWDEKWQTSEPIVTIHLYENRVAASHSVLNYTPLSEQEIKSYGVFEYPKGSIPTVLSRSKRFPWGDKYFSYLNGRYGPDRLMRLWVLIFENQDRDAALAQQRHWKNGNKNEFVMCIGIDKAGKVLWGEVFSWTERDELPVLARNYIENIGILTDETMIEFAKWVESKICCSFVKPEFTDKYAHLRVDPPLWIVILVWGIILGATIGMCIFIVKNELEEGENLNNFRNNNRRYRRW